MKLRTLLYVGIGATRMPKVKRTVPKHLQAPAMLIPFDVTNGKRLAFLRDSAGSTAVAEGVNHRMVEVPRRDGSGVTDMHLYERPDRDAGSGVLFYIHGGGFVTGAASSSHHVCSALAEELNVLVASVNYRLAPEHRFPSALHDCQDALANLYQRRSELRFGPERIVVTGESAGAGLAACLAQTAHDAGEVPIAGQVLTYPMLDDRTPLRPHDGRGLVGWTPKSNGFAWRAYLGRAPSLDAAPPYAAAARREDLSGLPPTWIGVGTLDLFYDESVDYARRLAVAGVDCELHIGGGLYHGADAFPSLAGQPEVKAFIASRARNLRRMLGLGSVPTTTA